MVIASVRSKVSVNVTVAIFAVVIASVRSKVSVSVVVN